MEKEEKMVYEFYHDIREIIIDEPTATEINLFYKTTRTLINQYAAPYKERVKELEKDRDEYRERYTCNQHTVVNLQSQLSEQRAMVEELVGALNKTNEHLKEFYPYDDPTNQLAIFVIEPLLAKYSKK